MLQTIAVIADVHSNHFALEAILADLRQRGADWVVNLGDNLNGPLEPQRCADLLRTHCQVHVRGNGDRMTAAGGPSVSAQFAHARIDAEARAWLDALPLTATGEGWLACHGSPSDDEFYLLEEVGLHGVTLRSDSEIAAVLGSRHGPAIFCGHTHVPRVVRLGDGRTVINPGSVGLAAYSDVRPHPHRMECGSPHARYAVVRIEGERVEVDCVCVAYDWTAAATLARQRGFDEWVGPLLTGRA